MSDTYDNLYQNQANPPGRAFNPREAAAYVQQPYDREANRLPLNLVVSQNSNGVGFIHPNPVTSTMVGRAGEMLPSGFGNMPEIGPRGGQPPLTYDFGSDVAVRHNYY